MNIFIVGKYLLKFNIKDTRTTSETRLMRSVGKNLFKISNIDTGAIFKIGSKSTRFTLLFYFYTPWKPQKISAFMTFWGGMKMEYLREMG